MKTTNNFKYSIKNNILFLSIPKTLGEYNSEVQKAKKELCLNENIYFTEIKIKKS